MTGDVSQQRVREIATQAWRRIDTLHREPVAAIAEAIHRAIAEGGAPAQRWDTLPAAQRRLVAALERGPATATTLARAGGVKPNSIWVVLRRLMERRVVVRDRFTYRLANRRPMLLPAVNEDGERTEAVLVRLAYLGSVTAEDLRRELDITMHSAYATLLRLHARGRLVRIARGVYAAADTAERRALADPQVPAAAQVG